MCAGHEPMHDIQEVALLVLINFKSIQRYYSITICTYNTKLPCETFRHLMFGNIHNKKTHNIQTVITRCVCLKHCIYQIWLAFTVDLRATHALHFACGTIMVAFNKKSFLFMERVHNTNKENGPKKMCGVRNTNKENELKKGLADCHYNTYFHRFYLLHCCTMYFLYFVITCLLYVPILNRTAYSLCIYKPS